MQSELWEMEGYLWRCTAAQCGPSWHGRGREEEEEGRH